MSARYHCGTEGRRTAVEGNPNFNGIDYVEVSANQLSIEVHYLKDNPVLPALPSNYAIDGGVRVTGVKVTGTSVAGNVVTVTVDRPGDYSRYTLRLQKSESDTAPPDKIDPQLSSIDLFFKIDCPNDFDCAEGCDCPVHGEGRIEIDYLAKDYESFRRVMLDRMALTIPQWTERNPADAGVALVELLAYVGDALSYEQDAVATEAYLGTARRRSSVRRHARLLDYPVDDGANARVWVCITTVGDLIGTAVKPVLPKGKQLVTRLDGTPNVIDPNVFRADLAEAAGALLFETVSPAVSLYEAHNEMRFYTWSSSGCCLPSGATKATLDGAFPNLARYDVLVLREKRGPESGSLLDADPTRAHAVRLTSVEVGKDPVTTADITEIEWHDEDRLPFALCVSANLAGGSVNDVGVAHGNVVLADHGRTVLPPLQTYSELLPPVPAPNPALARATRASAACGKATRIEAPLRYRPRLAYGPVTQSARLSVKGFTEAQPFDPTASAASAMPLPATGNRQPSTYTVLPHITLKGEDDREWRPQRELLESDELAREFVVETENDGSAALRFGDDVLGRRPDVGTQLQATYRIGNGSRGNVGAKAIHHIVSDLVPILGNPGIESVVNYTPGIGGADPESISDVKLKAPVAFRRQERAVTPADYEEVATRHPDVQRAAATFRWTGSWYTVFITVDRAGGRPVDRPFRDEMQRHIDRYRMAGYDVEIDAPRFVPLELSMHVCVLPGYFRADVKEALFDVLGSRLRLGGQLGFFHPDRFTFGQSVYLSQIIAAVHSVAGVQTVEVTEFRRRTDSESNTTALDSGELKIGRLEIARLDNDPSFPENGSLRLEMGGGR